jgi:NAD(P) transhydrogenase
METLTVDLAVIGAGPAGQKGAIQGAKAGKKVALIDRLGLLGGACLNQGTIPSKTLRCAILDVQRRLHLDDVDNVRQQIWTDELKTHINKVIADENALLQEYCTANDIHVLYGAARFADTCSIDVLDARGEVTQRVIADKTLIATGSRPRHPIEVPHDEGLFVDSDQVFRMDRLPDRLLVLGGGIIGCEYATMFAFLGIEVLLLDRRRGLMRMLDSEIATLFARHLQSIGIDLRLGQNIQALRCSEDGQAEVLLQDGECLKAPCLFYSLGRVANVEGLNLEATGITLDKLGYVPVNPLFQTVCPHIYAAGDVIGPPGLASTSMEQGRLAVRNAFLLESHHFPAFFPYGIYTIPEISTVGPTEEALQCKGVHYGVGRASYYEIARGPMSGDTTGLIKLIFHAETLEVLAVHIIGTNATDLISLGQMAINFRARVDYFVDQIFNYPTFAEGFRIAALNGLNTLQTAQPSDAV